MTRTSPLAGPGGLVLLAVLGWATAAGLALAWLSSAPAADGRSVLARLVGLAGD